MKIIMFLNSYIDGISGGDKWALEICKRLVKKRVEVEVVTSKLGVMNLSRFLPKGVKYKVTTHEKRPPKNLMNILWLYLKRSILGILLNLKTKDDDILFATSNFLPDVLSLLFKKGKKATILHMSPPNPFYGYRGQFTKKINLKNFVRILLYYVNYIISLLLFRLFGDYLFVLPTTVYDAIKFRFPRSKIHITLNGVDLDFINKIPSQNKEYDACWLGRVHPQKGVDDLIEIYVEARTELFKVAFRG